MKKIAFVFLFVIYSFAGWAKENVNMQRTAGTGDPVVLAGCLPSSAKTELNFNNVRTLILINGDMWWATNSSPGMYFIPKASGKSSLFSGALWIGGVDVGGNLRVAAQTYRQSGSDFWPGPLDITNTDITQDQCAKYDKHFKIHRGEVEDFLANAGAPGYVVPDVIKTWPGNGDPAFNQTHNLAPYYDNNGDGDYNSDDGDFPEYYFAKLPDGSSPNIDPCSKDILLGDETLWWVFNDMGNTHSETKSPNPIGLEIQAQAFAFATNDEINNMTFYRYKIINRNTTVQLDSCYFGQWVDADLGYYLDDYVGCDVTRGFGYCYNGDQNDEGAAGYGINPPAVGVDFFQGPTADTSDGIDNDRDGCIDCTLRLKPPPATGYDTIPDTILREQIIMSKFVYYNNDASQQGNPANYQDYYRYLRGIWRNGARMTYGGNGFGAGPGTTTDVCDFMFPGDSDPKNYGTNGIPEALWTEVTAGNTPADRRFLQSAGPFTLMPGAVNYITTGVVWARATNGGVSASVQLLRQSDDFAQALFDNCFKIINGPDAPDVAIREMDKELIFSLTNDNPIRNNYKETYIEKDPSTTSTSFYSFEGYQVFQLRDQTVTSTDLRDADKARIVQQFDVKNGISQIINFDFDAQLGAWNGYEAVNGADKGLRHTFRINEDLFATGNRNLVNHKTYYFMVVAYAYNSAESPSVPTTPAGRNKPYLSGRNNIKVYTAIPHNVAPEQSGIVLNSNYGKGPEITRLEGKGNGIQPGSDRLGLDFKSADNINSDQVAELLTAPYIIKHPTYAASRGPVDIRVYDPVKIIGGDFQLWETVNSDTDTIINEALHDTILWKDAVLGKIVFADTIWKMANLNTADTDVSDRTLKTVYDQVFSKYGFYVNMAQSKSIGTPEAIANGAGFIEANVVYQNPKRKWLGGVNDIDGVASRDWIASGKDNDNSYGYPKSNAAILDADAVWEKLIGGTWAPYKFTRANNTLAYPLAIGFQSALDIATTNEAEIASVDIVITSDKSKWSKCVVIEEQCDYKKAVGGAPIHKNMQGFIRQSSSLDINGNVIVGDTGYSYFPGYAVNVNTGERLNIAFGENSYFQPDSGFAGQTGGDMKWNPTSNFTAACDSVKNYLGGDSIFNVNGGMHPIYVFGHMDVDYNVAPIAPVDTLRYMTAYDEGQLLHKRLSNYFPLVGSYLTPGRAVWSTCIWAGYVKLNPGESLLSNDVRVRLRVSNPYKKFQADPNGAINDTMPKYSFSTHGLVASKGNVAAAKTALDLINVVPNPYYAYSSYEKNQLDHRVKIVNLPTKCSVKIFSPSGMLIRKLNRDVTNLSPKNGFEGSSDGAAYPTTNLETALEWDLKNEVGIPVASGIYIIHVDAPGVGEKTIKLFAVQRPIDLDTF